MQVNQYRSEMGIGNGIAGLDMGDWKYNIVKKENTREAVRECRRKSGGLV